MKTTIFKLVFAVGALFALANCSKSDDSSSNRGYCSGNQVYSQQYGGCLNQGNCAYGQGQMPNGQCVQGTIGGGYNNGSNMCGAGQVYADIGAVRGTGQQLTCLPVGSCAQLQQFNPQYPNYGFYQIGNGQAVCVPAYNNGGMYNNTGW